MPVRLAVSTFGDVAPPDVSWIVDTLEECYERLAAGGSHEVRLCIFETSSLLEAFFLKERSDVGVSSTDFGQRFFAMHEAWRGTSRITACIERMRELPLLVQEGGMRHEVGHSILHGHPNYYTIPVPRSLAQLGREFDLPANYLINLLYLTSIAVKDYEVTRLLCNHGYLQDQAEYVKHLLATSDEDILAWNIAMISPAAELLYLLSHLKVLSCAAPLLANPGLEAQVEKWMLESTSHLPPDRASRLLNVPLERMSLMGLDTIKNIEYVADLLVDVVASPILSKM